ncbi:asparagine synthase-like protein [Paramyrothecium foliicola]|nr:asparagine synthase-like protein [Paramyrothecium foliicola]
MCDHRPSSELLRRLTKRGPDHIGTVEVQLGEANQRLFTSFTSTVLALRGDHIAQQPLVNHDTDSVLCWNGEAWRIHGRAVEGNDGEAVLQLLTEATHSAGGQGAILDALRAIEGPFAFIYLDKPARRMYYGRDRLGRRSLLFKQDDTFSLSSIADAPADGWHEVEANGFYSVSLSHNYAPATLTATRHLWAEAEHMVSSIGIFNSLTVRPPAPEDSASGREAQAVEELHSHLTQSLRYRVLNVPNPPQADVSDARVAVLFSGGLDCTVLARMASDVVPPGQAIDLINVAFENPRIASQHKGDANVNLYELCPDRITGRKSFAELAAVCPERTWRLVTIQVDVPYTATLSHRDEVIRLIHPHNTEMDLSIAYALYFAARGQGSGQAPDTPPAPYGIKARVLLSGLGADELFGGYVRHATAYSRKGLPGLVDELKLDVSRLGKRNLGRDDRVMAHWGKEVRFPFLDESLVKWAIELPAWEKCDFEKPATPAGVEPEKRILRLLAKDLKMKSAAGEKKRAVSTATDEPCLTTRTLTMLQIQFGARTAKMESGKTKGTTIIGA